MRKTHKFAKLHLELSGPQGIVTETTPATTFPTVTVLKTFRDDPRQITVPEHKLSEAEVAARFENRRKILQSACRRYANSSAFRSQPPRGIRLPRYPGVMNVTVMYCPIQKTGSTTWKGILRSIGQNMPTADIRGIEVNVPFGKHDVSFTFVREPYSRLLSAYVDKLLSPNTLFSKMTGRYVIAKFRQNASKKSIDCGYDVTFPEFVRYFIHAQTSGQKRNGHFIPTHDHCGMCQRPYKYIGHLETLKDDMPFILKAMQSPVAYNKSFDNVTIKNGAAMILNGMRNGIKQCMDLDEACRRVWKKWQIRGIISKTLRFPLSREETQNISATDFEKAGLAALARSGEKSELIKQKKEALKEAFASVPLEDKLEVQKLLFLDFEMFGFDAKPDEVFPKEPYEPDPNFSYFDLYK